MASSIRTVSELVKVYKVNMELSLADRLAHFLNEVAEQLPGAFVDKRLAAKVILGMRRIPSEDGEEVKKKLNGAIDTCRSKNVLANKYGRELCVDRIEGIRATVDSSDIVTTRSRDKRNRIRSAVRSYERTDALIDVRELRGSERKEVQEARKAHLLLTEYLDRVPALPPKKKYDTDE